MPNVTFSIDAKRMPADENLAALSRDCVELCTHVLGAELKNVHVIFLAVRHGHGHPVFADIRYRGGTPRTSAVMNRFMEALDRAIVHRTGLTARIRCFGYTASSIHARN
ncbi:hypothetical protein [Burkholderia sp. Ac-20344]|uniref:hypothetical protein n=1 Tax=Burkholderia sp. Ac-20344 TaxID=2703890 RepID=UPI00197C22FC|nr:hypothetical protein [Burkholderia sp. Ac-20344]MBN3836442.1 hypothetical protein [Burkholderia sp. Ac-20344]